ncbi:S24 family peptidase [Salinivibrio sp. VYel1]|uniref:S24 family peptidase n=1 Tax=Salinivibrio sp. VYel1 TaxID=2490490 RepID=UPI00128B3DC2|nr:S24 family peptidase [Salinivibrio sp. VYel1]MPX91392.1 phage repressor protein [Salinivibrio sp. VYel1]
MTIGDRVKQRRVELGLTQDELARRVAKRLPEMKFSRISISNLELGIQKGVKDRVLVALTYELNCRAQWLAFGDLPVEEQDSIQSNVSPGPKVEQKCPLISWVQAGAFTAINEYPEQDYEYYPCPSRCGPRTFILTVRGDSMLDRFCEGDLIYVDPDIVEPEHGKFVVAQLEESNEATFKQLQIIDGQKILKALNPNYPPDMKYIKINGNCRLVGTVVAHVRPV